MAAHGATLAADDNPSVCRLVAESDSYRHVGTTKLADLVPDLPGGADGEMDIEGLAVYGDHLWIVGSHAPARKQPKEGDDDARHWPAWRRCAMIRTGTSSAVSLMEPTAGGPADLAKGRTCRCTRARDGCWIFWRTIPISRFPYPAKENGLDVEGLAAVGEGASFSACAGRCCAAGRCCSSCNSENWGPAASSRSRSAPPAGATAGIFSTSPDSACASWRATADDLLLLAGPTMDLDGPVHIYRWSGAVAVAGDSLVRADELGPPVLSAPYGRGRDHAEGMTLLGGNELLVVYDLPDEATRFDRRDEPARRRLPPQGGLRS